MGGGFAGQMNKMAQFLSPKQIAGKDASELLSWGYALNTWQIAVWSLVATGDLPIIFDTTGSLEKGTEYKINVVLSCVDRRIFDLACEEL